MIDRMDGWVNVKRKAGLFNETILPTLVTRLVDEESLSARVVKARAL